MFLRNVDAVYIDKKLTYSAIQYWEDKIDYLVHNPHQLQKYCNYLIKYLKYRIKQSNFEFAAIYIINWWETVENSKYFDEKNQLFIDLTKEIDSICAQIKHPLQL